MNKFINITFIIAIIFVVALFIDGNRKGRELIENAEITSTAKLLTSANVAAKEFKKAYNFLPGDLPNPEQLPFCTNAKCHAGNGNSVIESTEETFFWEHLHAAQLLDESFNRDTPLGGRLFVFYHQGDRPLPYSFSEKHNKNGHYLALIRGYEINKKSYFLPPQKAGRLDRKLDDGAPSSGNLIGAGNEDCVRPHYKAGKDNIIYNEPIPHLNIRGYRKPCAFLYYWINSPEITP